MKKVLSLFMLLCTVFTGAWAQPNWSNQGALSISPAMKNGKFAAGTVFYTIQNKGVGSGCVRSDNLNNGVLYINSSANTSAAAQWAIIGDNTNGFMFVNRDTKTAIAMQPAWTNDNTNTNATNDAIQYLGKLAATDADYTRFAVTPHVVEADANNGYFVIANKDVTHAYWNNRSNLLGYWYTSDDRGYKGWDRDNTGDNGASWKLTAVEALYVDGVKFTLKNKMHNLYLGVHANGTQLSSTSECTDANTWTLKAVTGGYKLYNESANKYAGTMNTRDGAIAATDEANAGVYTFEFNNGFVVLKCAASTTGYYYLHQVTSKENAVVDWNAGVHASQWAFCALESDIEVTTAQVTYNYKLGDRIYKTVQNMQTVGNMPTAPVAQPFVTFSETDYTLTEVTEEGITININCTEALPFAAATDFNHISTWYNVRLHSNQTHYQYYKEGGDGTSDICFTNDCPEYDKRYAWGFVGNLIDGFQMYNYVAGESKAVNTANPSVMAADNNTLILATTTTGTAGGFCLARSTGNYLNYSGGYIKNYGQADAGSTFRLTEMDVTAVPITVNYTTSTGITWTASIPAHEGDNLDGNAVAADFYKNFVITTANKTVSESNKTFDVTCDEDFPFTVGQPTRIQNTAHPDRMDFYVDGSDVKYLTGSATAANNSNLWYFEHASVPDPYLFTVKNFGTNTYLTFENGERTAGTAQTEIKGSATDFADQTSYVYIRKGNGGFCIQHPKYPKTCYSTHITESSKVGGWPAADATAALNNADNALKVLDLESFTANLAATDGVDHYGSIYLPYTMTLPEGIEAYAAAKEGDVLKLTKVGEAGAVIPAGAYILYSTSEESATLTLNETATVSAAGNELDGRFVANVALPTGSNYVLNNKDGVGFYKYSKTTYPVAKAVFCAGESPVSAFRFDFETEQTTSIESLIQNMKLQGEVLDLQGRRLNKAQKGMNIINGHKVLVK